MAIGFSVTSFSSLDSVGAGGGSGPIKPTGSVCSTMAEGFSVSSLGASEPGKGVVLA